MTDRQRMATTNWSLIRAAGNVHSESSKSALEQLFRCYWFPMYVYVRRKGRDESTAQDVVQSFVAMLLERDDLARVEPAKGKFRSFLFTSLRNFLNNDFKRNTAQKRGGGVTVFSIDFAGAEGRMPRSASNQTAERLFEKEWGLALINQSLNDLRDEYRVAGKTDLFRALSVFLTGVPESGASYQQVGRELGMSESAVKSAVFRMRRTYRLLLRGHISQTVASEEEIDEEIRELFHAVQ